MNGLASEGTATPLLDDACSLLPPQAAELADLDGDTSSKRMKINVIDLLGTTMSVWSPVQCESGLSENVW